MESSRYDVTYQKLLNILEQKRAGFILLLDPDNLSLERARENVSRALEAGVDVFLVGGSFLLDKNFNEVVKTVKENAGDCPVIIFPGSLYQISPHADALLFLSLISGRNPEHLIGNQAMAAPILWRMKLEAISCGYMLIESGSLTSAQYVSNSNPIPRNKPGIALAHALAAQYLGMKTIYLEAGSGARQTVPVEMIRTISETVEIPLLVGGGIRTPEEAAKKVEAGADFVVIGNFFEEQQNYSLMQEFAKAIHQK
ncbi:MAG: geranylgeranylglyceryl/heptaprenylglyceryl phosphate synthase [Calditrichaeota bacterium]|nr:MAG: geranylgeranylglyceryl/heptaprenylglyceryl phosphate synthase [Calditrichota bacterium]